MSAPEKKTLIPLAPAPGRWRRLPGLLSETQQRNILMLLLALGMSGLILFRSGEMPSDYRPGDIATRDLKAPGDLLVPDLNLTEKKRLEAERAALPLYDYDPRTGQNLALRLRSALTLLNSEEAAAAGDEALGLRVSEILGTPLTEDELADLRRALPKDFLADPLLPLIQNQLRPKIVGNLQLFRSEAGQGMVVRNLVNNEEVVVQEASEVIDLKDALQRLLKGLREHKEIPPPLARALAPVATKLLTPNLTFNKNESENRKRLAREEVKPVLYQIKKGEMLVREGERISQEQIERIAGFRAVTADYSLFTVSVGLILCIYVLFRVCHLYGLRNIRKYAPKNKDLLFLIVVFGCFFPITKLAIFISGALESSFPQIDSVCYYYMFPFAAGAILVRIVLNAEIALVFSVISALLFGALFGNSLFITFYALVGSLTGAHYVRQCEQRSYLYLSGLRLSLVNAVMVLGLYLATTKDFSLQMVYQVGFAAVGGILCAVIVTGTIPLAEALFGYTTNIKLLELANMNNPLLRELMVQAPGTYHHSIIVGNLAEAAAEAIAANPLVARVGAYYHDVGKIRKPQYFIENASSQENRHDKLAPSMSALILMAHVKDGAEMARAARLGEPIEEIIRQHHGTSLIKFFYDKAKKKEEEGEYQVDERDYRYPGPRPQSREAALIMLADAVEAASRTLSDPTPARIKGMVQRLINNIFIDGQLDNCELTLKDMHQIAKSFNMILTGMFHQRIDYPEPAFKEKESGKGKNGDNPNREPAKKAKDRPAEDEKDGQQDIKRLGMS
ncbi:MAG: HDIG domain-containing protein [Deltaproteobacteria bacterium]|nr:HDIG domain-containing protein [Deltaproteobacteria bacterium]